MAILDAMFGRMFNSGVENALTSGINFTGGVRGVFNQSTKLTDVSVAPATLTPAMAAVLTASIGVPFVIVVPFPALVTGAADDVEILASAPFALNLLDRWADVSAAIGASSVRYRSAAGGGGTALSGSIDTATVCDGRRASSGSVGASASVPANGSIFLRRVDRAVAGRAYLLAVRT